MDLVIECITKKYATFSGRARRKEYWLFTLFVWVGSFVLSLLDVAIGTFDVETGMGIISTVFSLVLLIPGIAVSVRRLHDTDRSGWWLLIVFIPLIGAIVILIFAALRGTPHQNRFGNDPLGGTAPETNQVMTETQ